MSEYIVSTDYERLWSLRQSGVKILGRWLGRGERSFTESRGEFLYEHKDNTIECWQNGTFQFIDPASQRRTTKEAAAEEMYELLQKMYDWDELQTCRIPDVEEVLKKARGEK